MINKETALLEFVKDGELLELDDIKSVIEHSSINKTSIEKSLVTLGLLSAKQVQKIVSFVSSVPFVDLSKKHISIEHLSRIPEPVAREHGLICFESRDGGGHLHIACRNLEDVQSLQQQENFLNTTIVPYLADEQDIFNTLRQYQKEVRAGAGMNLERALQAMRTTDSLGDDLHKLPARYREELTTDRSPMIFVERILSMAIDAGAYSVSFKPESETVVVNFSISGENYKALRIEKTKWLSVLLRLKMLADYPLDKELDSYKKIVTTDINKKATAILLQFIKTSNGEKASIILDAGLGQYGLFSDMFSSHDAEIVKKTIRNDKGIMYIAGQKKSGLTKTRYGLLSYAVHMGKDAISFEPTPEHDVPGLSQISLKNKKNPRKIIEQALLTSPSVVAFDSEIKTGSLPLASKSRSMLMLIETHNVYIELKALVQDHYTHPADLPYVSIINHSAFKKLEESNRSKYFLSDKEVSLMRNYLSPAEIKETLFGMATNAETARNVHFFKAKKKTAPRKIQALLGQENMYVRSIAHTAKILEKYAKEKNISGIEKDIRFLIKQSMLRSALPMAYRGEIDIVDLLKQLNS